MIKRPRGPEGERGRGLSISQRKEPKKQNKETNSVIPLHNPPRKPSKINPRFLVHYLPKIRLREHGQRVPGHCTRAPDSADEMRYGSEFSFRDDFERLAGLEGEVVFWYAYLCDAAGAGVDVEA